MLKNLPTLEEIGTDAEFISVKLGYRDPLIFSVDQGLKYITALRGCMQINSSGYGDDRVEKIVRFKETIEITFYSREELQEIIVGQELLLRGGPEDE